MMQLEALQRYVRKQIALPTQPFYTTFETSTERLSIILLCREAGIPLYRETERFLYRSPFPSDLYNLSWDTRDQTLYRGQTGEYVSLKEFLNRLQIKERIEFMTVYHRYENITTEYVKYNHHSSPQIPWEIVKTIYSAIES